MFFRFLIDDLSLGGGRGYRGFRGWRGVEGCVEGGAGVVKGGKGWKMRYASLARTFIKISPES